jgi:hypothetical protein
MRMYPCGLSSYFSALICSIRKLRGH